MLLIIIGGTPEDKRRARREAWKGALGEIEPDKVSGAELAAMASTEALFGGAQAYRVQNLFSGKRAAESVEEEIEKELPTIPEGDVLTPDYFLGVASALAESSHTFILEEEKILAKPLAVLKKTGAHVIELKAPAKKEPFNTFALANALGKRDRKTLWLGLMQANAGGVAPEQAAGILAWKARTLAASARGAQEKTLWSKISRDLVVMYHDSHRGLGDLSLLLERWTLGL